MDVLVSYWIGPFLTSEHRFLHLINCTGPLTVYRNLLHYLLQYTRLVQHDSQTKPSGLKQL
jgi:hypothetical protein